MGELQIKEKQSIRLSGLCGILTPLVTMVALWSSISTAPWFEWTTNSLSDLGATGASALAFNLGLVITGVLMFIFSLGLATSLSKKEGAYFLVISSLALICTGLFPMRLFPFHFVSSVVFFATLVLAFFIIGLTIKRDSFERNMGGLALLLSLVFFSSAALLQIFKGIAIPEAIIIFPAFGWFLLYGLKMSIRPEAVSF
jgi:hypothetical membrane protein